MTTVPSGEQAPASSAGRILLVAGGGFFATYDLEGRVLIVGRGPACEVRIDHTALSRRHAIVRGARPATVEDLGSTNGTRIAGVVRRGGDAVALAVGDSFQIGPFSFMVVCRGTVHERSPPTRDVLRVNDSTVNWVPVVVVAAAASGAKLTPGAIDLGRTPRLRTSSPREVPRPAH
jgi:hypothetical protein